MSTTPSLVAIPLPPPPATLVLVVDVFHVQDPDSIPKMRAALAALGYQTVLVLASTDGVQITHDGTRCMPIPAQPVPCPATAPHDQCPLCRGQGILAAL